MTLAHRAFSARRAYITSLAILACLASLARITRYASQITLHLEMRREPIADRYGHLAKILPPSELVIGVRQEIQPLHPSETVMQLPALMKGDTFILFTLDDQRRRSNVFRRPIGNLLEAVFVKAISHRTRSDPPVIFGIVSVVCHRTNSSSPHVIRSSSGKSTTGHLRAKQAISRRWAAVRIATSPPKLEPTSPIRSYPLAVTRSNAASV